MAKKRLSGATLTASAEPDHPQSAITSHGERVLFLDSLRAVAIIMVVGVHVTGYCIPLSEREHELVSLIVHTISVPVFFLVDGFLFARSRTRRKQSISEETGYWQSVKKNALRLLVPWAIFSLLYTVARYFFEASDVLKEKLIIGHSFGDVAFGVYASQYAPQMYFLVSLFLIRLSSPIFNRVASLKSLLLVTVAFLGYLAIYEWSSPLVKSVLEVEQGQEPILHAFWGIQYYLLGILLFRISQVFSLKKLLLPSLAIFLIAALAINQWGRASGVLFQYFYLVSTFLMFVVIGNRLRLLDVIGKNTMGIYLVHAPIVLKIVSIVSNRFITNPIASYASILFGTTIVSMLIVALINIVPHGRIVFGAPAGPIKPKPSD